MPPPSRIHPSLALLRLIPTRAASLAASVALAADGLPEAPGVAGIPTGKSLNVATTPAGVVHPMHVRTY